MVKLLLMFGIMAADRSTLSKKLAAEENATRFVHDEFLAPLTVRAFT